MDGEVVHTVQANCFVFNVHGVLPVCMDVCISCVGLVPAEVH